MNGRYQLNNPFIDFECNRVHLDKAPLNTLLNETYGQCNEDLIIEALLYAQCLRKNTEMSQINYVDIGGSHPFQTSSTYLFYRLYGASGVICEANPRLATNLQTHRHRDVIVNCAVSATREDRIKFYVARAHELSLMDREHVRKFERGFGDKAEVIDEIEVKNIHINDFLKTFSPGVIDYLSIDVEGVDYAILEAMDMDQFRPTFLQLEHNSVPQTFTDLLAPRDYEPCYNRSKPDFRGYARVAKGADLTRRSRSQKGGFVGRVGRWFRLRREEFSNRRPSLSAQTGGCVLWVRSCLPTDLPMRSWASWAAMTG